MDIAVQPQGKVLARGRRRRLLIALGVPIVPIALVAVAWATLGWLDRSGHAFYTTGSAVVRALDGLAREMKAGDLAAAERRFAASYRGAPLGLLSMRLVEERDGVRVLEIAPPVGAGDLDRAAALDEWRSYLAGFSSIEELGLFVHRVEEWDAGGDVTAVARLELIGTPTGAPRSVIDRAYVHMVFGNGPNGPEIREARLESGDRVAAERPQFVDVGAAAGVAFENRYYPRFLDQDLAFGMIRYGPGGITAADYDADGFYDLFVPDGVESKLLRNLSDGTFADVTAAAGLSSLSGGSVALFADYDNDGHKDLFVSRTFEPNQLFHNDGDGTFTNVTAGSGLGAECCTTVGSWADYDRDGDLDLYVGRYLDPREAIPTTFYARNGLPNLLYRNDGDGRFTDVTDRAGVEDPGLCLATVFGDYDDDGDPDLFVVNDFGRSTLYRNEGDGTFTDVTVEAGALAYGAGMNASMADYDNDGRLDLYTTDIRSEHGWYAEAPTVWRYMANSWRQGVWRTDMPLYFEIFRQSGLDFIDVFQEMASGNHLLRNRGDGTFEDVSWEAEANPLGWFWGAVFADFDNDGWQDLYAANGWVYNEPGTEIELEFLNNVVSRQDEYKRGTFFDPQHFGTRSWHGWERNRHLRNEGAQNGRPPVFREIGRGAGTDLVTNSRGVAFADFWNRGAIDLAVAASADRHALLRNEVGSGRAWLQVELVGTRSNRDAVGARVTLTAGGTTQTREVTLGDGYASQSSLRLHFGLGDLRGTTKVDELTVRWPATGEVQRFRDVAPNRIVEITEGRAELVEKRYEAPVRTAAVPAQQGAVSR